MLVRARAHQAISYVHSYEYEAGLVAHPVTQVIGKQASVVILDLSEVTWTCWGVSTPSSGLGLRMGKELDLQLALEIN